MIYLKSFFDIVKNKKKIYKEINTIVFNDYNKNENNQILTIKLNNIGRQEYNELLGDYNKNKGLNIKDDEINELISELKIIININIWTRCKGVFCIKSQINNRPVKMWYRLIPKGDINTNPPKYKINLIEIKSCSDIFNKEQIYFNNKNEIKFKQIYNYLKNEIFDLLKNVIYIIDY